MRKCWLISLRWFLSESVDEQYIKNWKMNPTAQKKPNNNKNHTNDGMKAEYGWNIVLLHAYTCASRRQEKNEAQHKKRPKPSNLKAKHQPSHWNERDSCPGSDGKFSWIFSPFIRLHWQMMAIVLIQLKPTRILAHFNVSSQSCITYHSVYVRLDAYAKRETVGGDVKGRWFVLNRRNRWKQ